MLTFLRLFVCLGLGWAGPSVHDYYLSQGPGGSRMARLHSFLEGQTPISRMENVVFEKLDRIGKKV